jgi:hypothetical protein
MGEAKRKRMLNERLANRQCGECTLCCKLMGVEELDKAGGTYCQHCRVGNGCNIYPTRPSSCATWHCGWLDPLCAVLLPSDDLRPDRCGFVVSTCGTEELPFIQIVVDLERVDEVNATGLIDDVAKTLLKAGIPVSLHMGGSDAPGVMMATTQEALDERKAAGMCEDEAAHPAALALAKQLAA